MITTKNINFYQSFSELYAARNSINNVTDLSDLTKLKILDMEKWVDLKTINLMTFCYSNDLQSFDSISFLYLCPKLQTVTFRGNPIADAADYQDRIRRYFPRCPLWIVKNQIVKLISG